MAEVTEQSQGLTDLMKQILDGFNVLKAGQIETQEAVRGIQARTDAMEARMIEAARQVVTPLANAAAATVLPTAAPPPSTAPSTTVAPPGAASASDPFLSSGMPREMGYGSSDRRAANLFRGDAPGILGNPLPPPGTGATQSGPLFVDPARNLVDNRFVERRDDREIVRAPAPKIEFPKFDGENPKLWQQQCETYFEVFRVQPCLRTRYAALGFQGNAALWFQGVETKGRVEDWDTMCRLVHDYFGKNKQASYRHQMRVLRQTSTISDYWDRFSKLRHQLLLYNPHIDEGHFVDEFIAGLRDDIRSAIWLHRPQDLETAHLLALLQEEESVPCKKRSYSKSDFRDNNKSKWTSRSDDISRSESKRTEYTKSDDKLEALKAYRRSKGLCFTCGEKYSSTHKCPTQVPLHVIEELLEVLQIQPHADMKSSSSSDSEEEAVMMMGSSLPNGKKRKSFRLQGTFGKHHLLILVDSGSVSSFINQDLVNQLQCTKKEMPASTFVVANGQKMTCDTFVPSFEWTIQGHKFVQDIQILPLGCYDMILGHDWLDSHSPMWIHWRRKVMRFTHQKRRITLHGVKDNTAVCRPVQFPKLKGLHRRGAISHIVQVQLKPDGHTFQVDVLEPDKGGTNNVVVPEIQQLLDEFQSVFASPTKLPPSREADHRIPLIPGAQPIKARPYRYTPQQKSEIEAQVKEMLAQGIIQRSVSSFASPVLLVKKKDGTWRFCVDYRQLNELTIKHKYPVPIVEELLDELAGAQWFTKLDLRSGYHQICLADGDQHKTAFQTHHGLFEFLVMPFGLTNAPASFQSLMNQVFSALLRKCVLVFVDDILVYSSTLEKHISDLRDVLMLLQQNQLLVKFSKCSFAKQELEYLGHIIGRNGVATDPSKLSAVVQWPKPKTLKDLRGFLGLTGYYRRFIRHYGILAQPLTHLLKKGILFQWGPEQNQAFELLKEAMSQAPVLALPDFAQSFVLETDACNTGIGAVLMQNGHPVAFLSQALCSRSQTLSTYEKECMAIILAVDKWRAYLQHREFTILTDHQSLMHLSDQRLLTGIQHKAFVKLLGLQFVIKYKKGISNAAADALSRQHDGQVVAAISKVTPMWMENLQNGYVDDAHAQQLILELSVVSTHSNDEGYSYVDGLLRYKDRIWVGNNSIAQAHILQALHSSGVGGHSGVRPTYERVKQFFAWPKLKQSVQKFVASCSICQQAKVEHIKTPGLLQPLQVPTQAWEMVSLDFIEGLPISHKCDVILVVIDRFSKYGHFFPLKHPFTALQVAQVFIDNIYRLHGLPQIIVSDRDRIFTSTLWKELFRLSDTSLHMSSSYHPQTDGQTERLNQCLELYLRCAVHSCPRKWFEWLPLAEYWYNTTYHSSLERTPFEVIYGNKPRHLGIVSTMDCKSPDLEVWLNSRTIMIEVLRQQLLRAQRRMKSQADKKRSERQFAEGDLVYLKLQPFIQQSVETRSNRKLSMRYFGPYKVLARVGAVAYRLELPSSSKIHPVVHVSLLKPHVPPTAVVSDDSSLPAMFSLPSAPEHQASTTSATT